MKNKKSLGNKEDTFGQFAEKAVLLCTPENPILEGERQQSAELGGKWSIKEARERVYGVSSQTLLNWGRGGLDGNRERESIDRLCESLWSSKRVKLEFADFTDRTDKYEFGEKLGLSWQKTQLIFDAHLYAQPLKSRGYTLDKLIAERLKEQHGGVYHVYYYSPTLEAADTKLLVRATLRIRHVVPMPNELGVIACKLHIPCCNGGNESDFFPYQGLMAQQPRQQFLYFFFGEQSTRSDLDHDMVNMIVEPARSGAAHALQGMLASADVKRRMYATTVYIERQPMTRQQKSDRHYIKKLMREDLMIWKDLSAIERLWRQKPHLKTTLKTPYLPFE